MSQTACGPQLVRNGPPAGALQCLRPSTAFISPAALRERCHTAQMVARPAMLISSAPSTAHWWNAAAVAQHDGGPHRFAAELSPAAFSGKDFSPAALLKLKALGKAFACSCPCREQRMQCGGGDARERLCRVRYSEWQSSGMTS